MKPNIQSNISESNPTVADYVKAEGYDPSGLIGTDEYIRLVAGISAMNSGYSGNADNADKTVSGSDSSNGNKDFPASKEKERGGNSAFYSKLYQFLNADGAPFPNSSTKSSSTESSSLESSSPEASSTESPSLESPSPDGPSPEQWQKRLRHVFEYQDELIFIQEGTDVSYYPIYYRFPAHYHRNAYFDIAYVFHGTARFYFPGLATVDLAAGDFLIVPPESEHGECAVSEETRAITCSIRKDAFLRIFLSIFDGNPLLQAFFRRMLSGSSHDNGMENNRLPRTIVEASLTQSHKEKGTPSAAGQAGQEPSQNAPIPYLRFSTKMADGSEDTGLQELFRTLMEEHDRKDPYYNKMLTSLMEQIFVRLLRYHEEQMILPESVQFSWKPEYAAILHFIEANSIHPVPLEELAQQSHYSKRQLIRIIRECTGQNYKALIRKERMRLAKDLLAGTSLPIEEIASRCGYENFSSFSRAFLASEDMTPGAWRLAHSPSHST